MVGVPKSKGCRTCVQRKVRCDQTHPTCGNCAKGNRTCLGYGQDAKFQDEGPRLREKYQKQSSQVLRANPRRKLCWTSTVSEDEILLQDYEHPSWSAAGLDVGIDHQLTLLKVVEGKTSIYERLGVVDDIEPWRRGHHLFDSSLELATAYRPASIDPALSSPFLMQDQLLQQFKDTIAPVRHDSIPVAMRTYGTWLSQLPKLTGTDLLLDTAIRAVTLVHIGRLHNSDVFINESRPYYGKALRLLNKAILDTEKSMSNITLCATMLLSYYEMFASDDDASWVRHAGGASTLMRMRGPERHRTGFDREIFLSYRHTLIIEAFSTDVPSFLNEPVWRQLSEDIHQDMLSAGIVPFNRLELFGVVEQYNQQLAVLTQVGAEAYHLYHPLNGKTPKVTTQWLTAYTNVKEAQDEMHRIFSSLRKALSNLNLLPKRFHTKDPIIPLNYTYPNVFVSVNHVGYWTTQMVCNLHRLLLGTKMINNPLPRPSSFSISPSLSALPSELITLEQKSTHYSLECCRSVNHMLKSSFLGPFFAVYAMRLASRSFPPGGPLWKWTIAKLYQIGERHMMFARHVPSFEDYERGRDESRGGVLVVEEVEGGERDEDNYDDGNDDGDGDDIDEREGGGEYDMIGHDIM